MKKDYISSGEWAELEQAGKLEPREFGELRCYFCADSVTLAQSDTRCGDLPYCQNCGISYYPQCQLSPIGQLSIVIMPILWRDEQNNPTDIPQTETDGDTDSTYTEALPDTPDEKAPQHKDVRGQILTIFAEKNRPIQTGEFLNIINASRQSITNALKKLIAEKRVHQPSRGTYQLIPSENEVTN